MQISQLRNSLKLWSKEFEVKNKMNLLISAMKKRSLTRFKDNAKYITKKKQIKQETNSLTKYQFFMALLQYSKQSKSEREDKTEQLMGSRKAFNLENLISCLRMNHKVLKLNKFLEVQKTNCFTKKLCSINKVIALNNSEKKFTEFLILNQKTYSINRIMDTHFERKELMAKER